MSRKKFGSVSSKNVGFISGAQQAEVARCRGLDLECRGLDLEPSRLAKSLVLEWSRSGKILVLEWLRIWFLEG